LGIYVRLANPRGFCAGVDRAIEIVNRVLDKFGSPVYVRHEVVHNKTVVEGLRRRGAIFVDEVSEIPKGSTVIFSAHGVAKQVQRDAEERNLRVFDATCPLVSKVHNEVVKFSDQSRETVLIGHAGHPEVDGTLGHYEDSSNAMYLVENPSDVEKLCVKNPQALSFVTQTTLSVDDTQLIIDALRKRFPLIEGPRKDDICYATQNRQDAVKRLAGDCDLLLVVGSQNSSNSNRLHELALRLGCTSYLIDDEADIDKNWIKDPMVIGVTSGASAPEILVSRVLEKLREYGAIIYPEKEISHEGVEFSLPKALRKK
jgi:4-hydroxy-3-methylbut-2-enyl diphosphate reductase|tara:strand:+ start:2666 stop:3607 length:942 start_codon:yes stop_codon:yes gene_type:complete